MQVKFISHCSLHSFSIEVECEFEVKFLFFYNEKTLFLDFSLEKSFNKVRFHSGEIKSLSEIGSIQFSL